MNKDFKKTLITSAGVTSGALVGKIIAAKIPEGKIPGGTYGKPALIMAMALAGIYSLDRKDSTKSFGLDACIGVASSQIVSIAASLLGDKAKNLGLAGDYFDESDVLFLDDYALNGISDEDYTEDLEDDLFLSAPDVEDVDFM